MGVNRLHHVHAVMTLMGFDRANSKFLQRFSSLGCDEELISLVG